VKNAFLALFFLVSGSTISACGAGEESPLVEKDEIRCSSVDSEYDDANIRRCTARLQITSLSTEDRAMTFNIRGNNYDKLKKYDLAIADYTEVIRLLPKFEYAYANRALVKTRKGDFIAALLDYDQAVRINPKNSYAVYGRGVARLRSGDIPGGNADIAAAIRADPGIAALYREIGAAP
jgi:lipoprotein NlpI